MGVKTNTILLLTALAINFTTIDNTVVRKCCARDETLIRLHSGTHKCIEFEGDDFVPLVITGRHPAGFPDNCSETCIDKRFGDVIEVGCNKTFVRAVRKCCPMNAAYRTETKNCEGHYDQSVADAGISCPPNGAIVDYLAENSVDQCVDRTRDNSTIYRSCTDIKVCRNISCLRKCCPVGQVFTFSDGTAECSPEWHIPLDLNGIAETSLGDFAIIPGLCEGEINIVDSNYALHPNGSLQIYADIYDVSSNSYCIEHVEDEEFGYRTHVFFCLKPSEEDGYYLYQFICLIVSCVFLTLTLFIYFYLSELRNFHGKVVVFHISSFLAAFICLTLVKKSRTKYDTVTCTVIGYCMLFAFLAAFSWLNVMCFDIWWTFGMVKKVGRNTKERIKLLIYCLYAFGVPTTMSLFAFCADRFKFFPEHLSPHIGKYNCWFSIDAYPWADLFYFIVPVALQILSNIVLFVLTAYRCAKIKSDLRRFAEGSPRKFFAADRETFALSTRLAAVMGVTWVSEVVTKFVSEPELLWDTIATVNMLKGVWVFWIFVLKRSVWRALRRKLRPEYARDRNTSVQLVEQVGDRSGAKKLLFQLSYEPVHTGGDTLPDGNELKQ